VGEGLVVAVEWAAGAVRLGVTAKIVGVGLAGTGVAEGAGEAVETGAGVAVGVQAARNRTKARKAVRTKWKDSLW